MRTIFASLFLLFMGFGCSPADAASAPVTVTSTGHHCAGESTVHTYTVTNVRNHEKAYSTVTRVSAETVSSKTLAPHTLDARDTRNHRVVVGPGESGVVRVYTRQHGERVLIYKARLSSLC